MYDISVVIPTYNRNQVLCNTLDSVLCERNATQNISIEIIIIDQTSNHTRQTTQYLEEIKKNEKIVYHFEETPSLPNARNIGVRLAKGNIICFLDDDVLLRKGYFQHLYDAYKTHEVDAVSGRVTLINEGGNFLLENQNRFKALLRSFLIKTIGKGRVFAISSLGFILTHTNSKESMYVDAGRGCNMSFLKSVLEEVGGFDVAYRGNALREETDVYCRLKKSKKKVFYEPKAYLYHVMANTGGCRNETNLNYWNTYFFNQCYFYKKNFGFSLSRIKIILIFDYLKCKRNGIDVASIFRTQYSEASAILNEKK